MGATPACALLLLCGLLGAPPASAEQAGVGADASTLVQLSLAGSPVDNDEADAADALSTPGRPEEDWRLLLRQSMDGLGLPSSAVDEMEHVLKGADEQRFVAALEKGLKSLMAHVKRFAGGTEEKLDALRDDAKEVNSAKAAELLHKLAQDEQQLLKSTIDKVVMAASEFTSDLGSKYPDITGLAAPFWVSMREAMFKKGYFGSFFQKFHEHEGGDACWPVQKFLVKLKSTIKEIKSKGLPQWKETVMPMIKGLVNEKAPKQLSNVIGYAGHKHDYASDLLVHTLRATVNRVGGVLTDRLSCTEIPSVWFEDHKEGHHGHSTDD